MPLIKIKKMIGSSPESFTDALQEIINYATEQKYNVTGVKIRETSVAIKDSKIVEYKITAHVAYLWEKELYRNK